MRPLPAQRLGTAHGLMRALEQRGRLRLDEFVTEFAEGELFPPDAETDTGRTRQYLGLLRALGLVQEDRGAIELTDFGRRYARAGDRRDVFAVSPGQAEWLRRALRERHLTDSVWHGAAIGLSLYATLRDGEWVSLTDFGRCAAHLGRVGWDNENTFRMQGERFTRLLEDMELLGPDRQLTPLGERFKEELRLPQHVGMAHLAAQLHPDGAAGAEAAAREERKALGRAAGAASPPAPEAVPEPAEPPAPAEAGGYETVIGSVAVAPPADASPVHVAPEAGAGAAASPEAQAPPPSPSAAPPAAVPPPPEPLPPAPEPSSFGAPPAPAAPSEAVPPAAGPADAVAPPPSLRWPPAEAAPPATSALAQPAPPPSAPRLTRLPPQAPFLDPEGVRTAAERRGLRLDVAVYAAAIAALASGRHLLLTGGAGHGKTTLARAVADAAAAQGRAADVTFAPAGPGLTARELGGRRGPGGPQPGLLPAAAADNRWVVLDELDRTRPDRVLGRLSALLGGDPVDLPGGRVEPHPDWRIVATAPDAGVLGRASAALRRRFAVVEVTAPPREELDRLVDRWAAEDPVAAAVGRRVAASGSAGPATVRDAVTYARARNALVPADERTLAAEALAALVLPAAGGEDRAARLSGP